jgi:hypothetical protein
MASSAFQLLSMGGAHFNKQKFKRDFDLFDNGSKVIFTALHIVWLDLPLYAPFSLWPAKSRRRIRVLQKQKLLCQRLWTSLEVHRPQDLVPMPR